MFSCLDNCISFAVRQVTTRVTLIDPYDLYESNKLSSSSSADNILIALKTLTLNLISLVAHFGRIFLKISRVPTSKLFSSTVIGSSSI